MKRLIPIGGLGNRIRAILSARAVWGEVEVLWASSDAVSQASFTDVFCPLNGVHFLHAGNGHAHELTQEQCPHDVMTSNPIDAAPADWTLGYAEIRPLRPLAEMIDKLVASIGGPYVAVHARRCDHAEHAPAFGHFTSNSELDAWIGLDAPPGLPLYLATDCPDTHAWFTQRWQRGRVHSARVPERVHGYERRPGTLADAAVDMFMCARAAAFKGSWISSYSEAIGLIRWGGNPPGGYHPQRCMQSADAEFFRGQPERAKEAIAWMDRNMAVVPA